MINPYTESRNIVFLTVFAVLALVATPGAEAIETQAKQAYLIGEGFLGTRQPFGNDDAGIVAGLNDNAAQQILDANLGVDLDEHLQREEFHLQQDQAADCGYPA